MDIATLIEQQSAEFERDMALVIKRLNKRIEDLINKFTTEDGKLLVTSSNLDEAVISKMQLEKALKDSGYYDLAELSIKQNKDLLELRKGQLKDLLGRERLGVIDTNTLNALNVVSFDNIKGIGGTSVLRMRQTINNAVLIGLPLSDLRKELIGDSGMLKHQATTIIRTGKRMFSQQVEDSVAKQIGFGKVKNDIWEYSPGILQSNSHQECVIAVPRRYFTNAEKIAFEGGTIGGYSFNPARYNCVHNFFITNVTYKEAFGE